MGLASVTVDSAAIADRFLAARRAATPLASYPGAFPQTLPEAYEIQGRAVAGWGKPIQGWKVGRVNGAFSEQYHTDRLAGPIFDVTLADENAVPAMPVFAGGFAAAEAEFLLRLDRAPTPGQLRFSLDEAADLIGSVHVGLEIASSPLSSINDLGPVAIVSDFGNNNGLLVGPAIQNWRNSRFEELSVTTLIDGVEVGRGTASSFPNGAIGSAQFLLELLSERGIALAAGQWISSGAVTGVHDALPGQHIEARFGDEMLVQCTLVAAQAE
jgi:2-keto-4-pentenoate hydratase